MSSLRWRGPVGDGLGPAPAAPVGCRPGIEVERVACGVYASVEDHGPASAHPHGSLEVVEIDEDDGGLALGVLQAGQLLDEGVAVAEAGVRSPVTSPPPGTEPRHQICQQLDALPLPLHLVW